MKLLILWIDKLDDRFDRSIVSFIGGKEFISFIEDNISKRTETWKAYKIEMNLLTYKYLYNLCCLSSLLIYDRIVS